MIRIKSALLAIALVGFVASSVAFVVVSRGRCLPWEGAPDRDVSLERLLLDVSSFPVGWKYDPSGPDAPAGSPFNDNRPNGALEVFFYGHNSNAVQEVDRFACTRGAYREYSEGKARYPQPSVPADGWSAANELPYQSPVADQFYLTCGYERANTMCRALWQYQEYYVLFSLRLQPDLMSYADLERILQAVDDRLAQYLAGGTP